MLLPGYFCEKKFFPVFVHIEGGEGVIMMQPSRNYYTKELYFVMKLII